MLERFCTAQNLTLLKPPGSIARLLAKDYRGWKSEHSKTNCEGV